MRMERTWPVIFGRLESRAHSRDQLVGELEELRVFWERHVVCEAVGKMRIRLWCVHSCYASTAVMRVRL